MYKTSNVLFEIGFYGLPIDIYDRKISEMQSLLDDFLSNEGYNSKKSYILLKKNRYTVFIEGLLLPEETYIEVKGPLVKHAFDINGLPTQAAIGFANSQGVNIKDLIIKKVNDEEFIFARKRISLGDRENFASKLTNFLVQLPNWRCKPYKYNSSLPQPPVYFCMLIDEYLPQTKLDDIKCDRHIFVYNNNGFQKILLEKADDYINFINLKIYYPEKILEELTDKINLELHSFELHDNLFVSKKNIDIDYISFINDKPEIFVTKLPEKLFSNFPQEIITKFIGLFKFLLPIHDKNGNISKYAIGIKNFSKPYEFEIKLIESQLSISADKLLEIWQEDLKISYNDIIEKLKISESINCVESLYDFLLRVKRRALKIIEILKIDISENLLDRAIFLIGSSWVLGLAKIFPTIHFILPELVIKHKPSNETSQAIVEALSDIAKGFENTNALPKTDLATVILLAYYFNLAHDKTLGEKYRNLVLRLIINKKIYIDLLKVFTLNEDTLEFSIELWRESIIKFLNDLGISINSSNYFLNLPFLVPQTIIDCITNWKNDLPPEFMKIKSYIYKMYNFVNEIEIADIIFETKPEEINETKILYILLEKLQSINRYDIINFVEIFKEFIGITGPIFETQDKKVSNIPVYRAIKKCLEVVKNHCLYDLIESDIREV